MNSKARRRDNTAKNVAGLNECFFDKVAVYDATISSRRRT
jgi:hypothetical protein